MNARLGTQEGSPVSLGDWILTLIVLMIPLVNIIMLFVWGFSGGTHPSKQNFCRAQLVLIAIFIVLAILFAVMGGFAAMSLMQHAGGGAAL